MYLEQAKAAANINPLAPGAGSTLDPDTSLVLASRNSQLALVQSSHVSEMLSSHFGNHSPLFRSASDNGTPPDSPTQPLTPAQLTEWAARLDALGLSKPSTFPITSMSTFGDQNLRSPLYVIGGEGKAIWTKELEVALAQGAVDAIVHCLKDVPTELPPGLTLASILEREDPRDALVIKDGLPYKTLDELPPGSVIGTSSVRRVAQLRRRYPNLVFSDVRGNLNTRLAKLDSPTGPYTALVLAAAGLVRLGMASRITAFLSAPVLMYSVGQGSLAIEVRTPPEGADPRTNRDARIFEMVRSIGDWRATWRAEAERSLLRELEGGCSIPVGVETRFEDHDAVEGVRCERAAVQQVNRSNGLASHNGGDEGAEALLVEGHTIPTSQVQKQESSSSSSSSSSRPSTLQRLATDRPQPPSDGPASGNGHMNGDGAVERGDKGRLMPEDRATEPSGGAKLLLYAIVVSLDGTRHCGYEMTKHCHSVDDARQLGQEVARELATKRGARSILEEVERHRKLAEAADEKRRKLEKEKRAAGKGNEGEGENQESRKKLEEALNSTLDSNLVSRPNGEVDRRGVPRDDGQPKAWEV